MTEVKKFFADAFRHLGNNRPVPEVEVRFYPYAGLHHTIRVRSGRVYVRLSDICKGAPPDVVRDCCDEALVVYLIAGPNEGSVHSPKEHQ